MSLVTTLMQPLRTKYAPKTMDKNEIRPSRYGAWDLFNKQSKLEGGLLTDEAKKLIKNSSGNTVNIPVLNAENVTIGNTRSCTIPSGSETSALVTLNFATFSFGFTMTPARHFNNDIGYEQLFRQKMELYLLKLADTLDTASINVLNTSRNVYHPAAITKYFPVVGNALQVGQNEKNDFFNKAESIMNEMDYYTNINVLGSTSLQPMVKRLQNQGASNAINESFQFDPYRWNFTNRIITGAGIESAGFLIPDGYISVANRNTPDQIAGSIIGPDSAPLKQWGQQQMPIVNLNMGTFYTRDCADMSALDGGGSRMTQLQRSLVEGFAFDTDICWVTAYNSDAANRYSPTEKFEISVTDAVDPNA